MLATLKTPPNRAPRAGVRGLKNRTGVFCRRLPSRAPVFGSQMPKLLRVAKLAATKSASGPTLWLSRDPIAERGGVNLYAYVGNNPVIYVDPYGLIRWGNLGTGVSQVATGGLKIAGAAALTAGAAPTGGWSLVGAAYLAIESAGNITIGLANIAISLSDDPDDDCLAKQLQGLPTSIPTAIARGVGGEMVQAGVDVAETIATGAVNLASNPTQKLDAVKDGVELVVKLNSAAEAAPGPYDHE